MSRVKEFKFGPGSLESITVRLWKHPDRIYGDEANYRIRGKVSGFYTVYCGAGWSHTVEINEDLDAWTSERNNGNVDGVVASLWLAFKAEGDAIGSEFAARRIRAEVQDAAADLAHECIDYALEDWFDPCADDEEVC